MHVCSQEMSEIQFQTSGTLMGVVYSLYIPEVRIHMVIPNTEPDMVPVTLDRETVNLPKTNVCNEETLLF